MQHILQQVNHSITAMANYKRTQISHTASPPLIHRRLSHLLALPGNFAVLLPTAAPVHGDVDGDLAGRILRLILAAGQRVLYHPANCHIDLNVSASRF